MNLQPHIKLVACLMAGQHPVTGEDLTGNPLDDAQILRLLARLRTSLESLQIEHGIKGSIRRRRAPWSDFEKQKLSLSFSMDGTEQFANLAVELERTPRSVFEEAVNLGLISSRTQFVTKADRIASLFSQARSTEQAA